MKKVILPLLALIFYTSCSKQSTQSAMQFDPNKAYTIKYKPGDQIAKTRVVDDTLHIDFYQQINFLLDPAEYGNSWALHLIQDFSTSYLKDLHFNAIATEYGYAHDWVPINLNDVAKGQKTISNVTVDGKKYVQVSLSRLFEFYNPMGSHQAAINEQNALLQRNNDSVTYKACYSYNFTYSITSDANFKIKYVLP